MTADAYSPLARQLFEAKGISPGIAMQVGVKEERSALVYPDGRKRSLDGRGRKHDQPHGIKLEPWVLYRPEKGGAVVVCEGETDALAVASAMGAMPTIDGGDPGLLSIPGTGTPTDRVVKTLAEMGGRMALIATDADEAGERWAAKLAGEIEDARSELAHFRVELPAGSDISDVLVKAKDRGRTLADLLTPPPVAETAELLDQVVQTISRFVVLGRDQLHAVALWVLHTYAIDAADTTPYLSISSPEKQCGKSLLLDVLNELVARPMATANASNAAIFRSLRGSDGDTRPVTLLFDEMDAIFGKVQGESKEELRGVINAGHRRGHPVYRCTGEKMDTVQAFPVFGPKALAGIGALPDTIADRSINIRLRRKSRAEKVERGRIKAIRAATKALKQEAPRWADRVADELAHSVPDLPESLSDRAQDGAEPLLALADLAGGDWPEKARTSLVALHESKSENAEDDGWGVRLLADIRTAFEAEDVDRLSSHALLTVLKVDEESPWPGWGRAQEGLTPRAMSKLLAPYSIRSRSIRLVNGETLKGFKREQFEDTWDRYLPPLTPSSPPESDTFDTTASQSQKPPLFFASQQDGVTDTKNGSNPHSKAVVTGVSAGGQESGPEGASEEEEAEAERLAEKFGEAAA